MKKARKRAITGISARRMLQKVRTSAKVLRQDSFSTCRSVNWDGKLKEKFTGDGDRKGSRRAGPEMPPPRPWQGPGI